MQDLGKMEDQIFKDRQSKELSFKARNKAKRRRERLEQNCQPKWVSGGQFAPMVIAYLNVCFTLMNLVYYFLLMLLNSYLVDIFQF